MSDRDKSVNGAGLEFQSPNSGGKESQTTNSMNNTTAQIPQGWSIPKPEKIPKPGYWPFLMAMGICFILWGLAVGFNEVVSTIILISGIGLVLFIIALAGWIGDLRDERKDNTD